MGCWRRRSSGQVFSKEDCTTLEGILMLRGYKRGNKMLARIRSSTLPSRTSVRGKKLLNT